MQEDTAVKDSIGLIGIGPMVCGRLGAEGLSGRKGVSDKYHESSSVRQAGVSVVCPVHVIGTNHIAVQVISKRGVSPVIEDETTACVQ